MRKGLRVGIIGGGWPGQAHAKGYQANTGFELTSIADLIPDRRKKMVSEFGFQRTANDGMEIVNDVGIDVVSICVPNHLHAPLAMAALKKGKHVLCEKPPGLTMKEAKQIEAAARKSGKILLYGFQRRFGPGEQACKQAIEKGYAGEVYHARTTQTRTRGIPKGTGWYNKKAQSGGGAMIDIGLHALDTAWYLLGQPNPETVFAMTQRRFDAMSKDSDVEDFATAMIKFEGGKSLELVVSWALNQPPQQNGTVCRLYGTGGSLEVYTQQGPVIYRSADHSEKMKDTVLKTPARVGHAALIKHFKDCIEETAVPMIGAKQGVTLMQMIDAIYKSAETGKSVEIKKSSNPSQTAADSEAPVETLG